MKIFLLPAMFVLLVGNRAMADDKTPSYTKEVKPFVVTYCAECHGANGAKPKAGVNLTSYDNLLKQTKKGTIVVPSQSDKSLMLNTLLGNAKKMPPAKYSKQPTAEEIAMIKAWIEAGAKDDSPAAPAEEKKDPAKPTTPSPKTGTLRE